MREFRIESNRLKFRALSWCIVVLLIVMTVFLFDLRMQGRVSVSLASWLGTSSLLGGLFGAYFLVLREVINRARRQMVFVMDEDQITRKRRGFPDVRIAFSEIEALSEGMGSLIITSCAPLKKIAIPNNVSGYDAVRAELAKHHAISTLSPRFPLKSGILLLVSVLSWCAVGSLHDMRIVVPSAVIALATLGFGSYQSWMLFRRAKKALLGLSGLCFAWIAAILLIYEHVIRR